MKIAIHYSPGNNFSSNWKIYCEVNNISYKIVNCYDNDIIEQLKDSNALMWHVNNFDYRDQIFAKNLIQAVEGIGIKVFPNINSVWHFDDKIAQKYLLESIKAPLVNTYIFYDKINALKWAENASYPKVFKLRRGSGSKNVLLVRSKKHAKKIIYRMFGRGIKPLSMIWALKERYRKYKLGNEPFIGLLKGVIRIFIGTPYLNMSENEKGYVYFQDFLGGNCFDQRLVVIGKKCFGIRRNVRTNDFRASGSGLVDFGKDFLDLKCIKIAFNITDKLRSKCMAFDFIYDANGEPKIIEISTFFNPKRWISENKYKGYWNENLIWHNEEIKPYEWMVEDLINS